MAHTQTRHRSHVAYRQRAQIPLPAVEDVAPRRLDVLRPSWLAPRQLERRDPQPPARRLRLAPAAAEAARPRRHPGERGVAAGAVERRRAAARGPRRLAGARAAAGQAPGEHETAGWAARGGAGAALGGGWRAGAGPSAARLAASTRGPRAGALPADRQRGRLDAGSAAPTTPGVASARGGGAGGQAAGDGRGLSPPPRVAVVSRRRGRACQARGGGDTGGTARGRAAGRGPGLWPFCVVRRLHRV